MSVWVKVKTQEELIPGLFFKVLSCGFCRKNHRVILLARAGYVGATMLAPGNKRVPILSGTRFFRTAGTCDDVVKNSFSLAVLEGRLFRLADETPAEKTTERELERVK